MITSKQHKKETEQFLAQFTPVQGRSPEELVSLVNQGILWERYGSQPWAISKRRKQGSRTDAGRLVNLQKKGWLFLLDSE